MSIDSEITHVVYRTSRPGRPRGFKRKSLDVRWEGASCRRDVVEWLLLIAARHVLALGGLISQVSWPAAGTRHIIEL